MIDKSVDIEYGDVYGKVQRPSSFQRQSHSLSRTFGLHKPDRANVSCLVISRYDVTNVHAVDQHALAIAASVPRVIDVDSHADLRRFPKPPSVVAVFAEWQE